MPTRSRIILEGLNAPKFVYRYKPRGNKVRPSELEKNLETKVLASKYHDYFEEYSAFAVFDWLKQPGTRINRDCFWKEYIGSIDNPDLRERAIFLAHKLNNEAFEDSLHFRCLEKFNEYRCCFQKIGSVDPLVALLNSTNAAEGKLRLHSLGLRVRWHSDNKVLGSVASYIQPLLEESASMYANLNYDKLLRIARNSTCSKDNSVKHLLAGLADKSLSSAELVNGDDWLLFTRSK